MPAGGKVECLKLNILSFLFCFVLFCIFFLSVAFTCADDRLKDGCWNGCVE